ncbi:MAG: hypothetical protein PHW76_05715 [Alphaproteobacteria bacterium]|nr:hypothetical protein [Alphaproteobacteria bacterium]
MSYDDESYRLGYNYGESMSESDFGDSASRQAFIAGREQLIADRKAEARLWGWDSDASKSNGSDTSTTSQTGGYYYNSLPNRELAKPPPPPLTEAEKKELARKKAQEEIWKEEQRKREKIEEEKRRNEHRLYLDNQHKKTLEMLAGYEALKEERLEFAARIKEREPFHFQAFNIDPELSKTAIVEASGALKARDRTKLKGPSECRKQRGFAEGTEIWTGKRLQSIETIEDGQDICLWDRHGERFAFGKVEYVEVRKEPTWEIKFNRSLYSSIRVAKDQPLWTVKGWSNAFRLASKSVALEMCNIRQSIPLEIKKITKTDEVEPVYNIITEKNFSYVANSILAVNHKPLIPFRFPKLHLNALRT